MEPFIQSVGKAFAENREALPLVLVSILLLLLLLVLLQLTGLVRRGLGRRHLLVDFAERHGLGREALALVKELARRSEAAPLDLLTHLDRFERSTATALAGAAADGGDLPARIRALRHALGFDRLPPHAPLLSTRELAPGTAVEVGPVHGQAFDVDERAFSVEVREPVPLRAGEAVTLSLVHAREARYAMRCRLRSMGPGPSGGHALTFEHDEAPERVQQREYARAEARGPITLRPMAPWLGHPPLVAEVKAELRDLSAGGARVATSRPLPVGLLASASFVVADALFGEVRAVVLSCSLAPGASWLGHLEFTGMPRAERERLATAVARLERASLAARHARG